MSAGNGRITDTAPYLMVRQLGLVGTSCVFLTSIKPLDNGSKVMLPATTPDHQTAESLLGEGFEHAWHHQLVHMLRKIYIAAAVIAMLRGRPEWESRQDQAVHRCLLAVNCCGLNAQGFWKPAVEVDW
jgi:hypothetical protein